MMMSQSDDEGVDDENANVDGDAENCEADGHAVMLIVVMMRRLTIEQHTT